MPLYDYECKNCGEIQAWGTVREAARPIICSRCGNEARRIITAPNLALMPCALKLAHERNEASAHEPKLMRREDLVGMPIKNLWHPR